MANNIRLEGAGDLESWPPNRPGKPTQVAVFGMYHPKKGKCCEILWTGQFPDLEPAMYWGAKKEMEAVRKGKWYIASRVLWQHELTSEQAVEAARQKMRRRPHLPRSPRRPPPRQARRRPRHDPGNRRPREPRRRFQRVDPAQAGREVRGAPWGRRRTRHIGKTWLRPSLRVGTCWAQ
jgi:hypothetical protein